MIPVRGDERKVKEMEDKESTMPTPTTSDNNTQKGGNLQRTVVKDGINFVSGKIVETLSADLQTFFLRERIPSASDIYWLVYKKKCIFR